MPGYGLDVNNLTECNYPAIRAGNRRPQDLKPVLLGHKYISSPTTEMHLSSALLQLTFAHVAAPNYGIAIPFALPVSFMLLVEDGDEDDAPDGQHVTFDAPAELPIAADFEMEPGSMVQARLAASGDERVLLVRALEEQLDAQLWRMSDGCWATPGIVVDLVDASTDVGFLELTVRTFELPEVLH